MSALMAVVTKFGMDGMEQRGKVDRRVIPVWSFFVWDCLQRCKARPGSGIWISARSGGGAERAEVATRSQSDTKRSFSGPQVYGGAGRHTDVQ